MKLSIITPSFNQAPFLPRTLESISAQTHPEIEHIIQDAGSTDGSLEILQSYAANKEHVRLTIEKDAGQADAINRGLRLATGAFLCWLNTDDYYEAPDVIAAVARAFEENPDADVVYGRGDFVAPTEETLRTAFIHTDPENLPHHLVRSVGILQPALFFRASLIHRAGLLDTEMNCAFDHELWTRFVAAGAKFHFLDRKLVNATFHQDAKSSRLRRTQILESAEVSRRYYSFASAEWITRSVEFDLTGRNQIFDQQNRAQPTEEQKALAGQIAETRFRTANSSNDARFAIISAPHLSQYSNSRKLAEAAGLVETNRVIATTFDDAYLEQGLTLIRSVRAHQGAKIPIVVYDLNLSPESKRGLAALANVHLASYPRDAVDSFPGFLHPKNYSYKCVAICDAARFVEEGGMVLWIDAGVAPISSLEPIYDVIRETGVFFVDHDDKADWPFYNGSFCHPRAAEALNATTSELFGEHLCSCLVGYRKGCPFQELFEEANRYARIEEAVIWSKHPALNTTEGDHVPPRKSHSRLSEELASRPAVLKALPPSQAAYVLGYFGHRQDQTIFSILAARYHAPIQSATLFCRSDDASSKVSKLNWASRSAWQQIEASSTIPAHIEGAVTYHHRGIYKRTDVLSADRRTSRELLILSGDLPDSSDVDILAVDWRREGSCRQPRYYLHAGENPDDGLEEYILQRETVGVELFVLREKVIASLREDIRRLSCIWNLDRLRTLAPEVFPLGLSPAAEAALVGAMLGYSRLIVPREIDSPALTLLADLNVEVSRELSSEAASSSPPLLDDNVRPVHFRIPPPSSIEDAVRKLVPAQETLVDLHAKTADFGSFPWNQKPGVIQCLLHDPNDLGLLQLGAFGLLRRHGYTIYLVKEASSWGHRIHPPYETVVRVGEGSYGGEWHSALAFRPDPGLGQIRQAFLEGIPLSSSCETLPPVGTELILAQPREADVQVDELAIVCNLLHKVAGPEKVLISVGADRETLRSPYLRSGWKVLASVSDAAERSYLTERYKKEVAHGRLILEARTASNKIEPLTASAPLEDLMQEYALPGATVLHLNTGGRDREALHGFPWHFCSPAIVISSSGSLAFLQDRGYRIFLSEWHPTLQSGVTRQWKTLKQGPVEETGGTAIALRADVPLADFIESFQAELATPQKQERAEPPPIVEEEPVLSAEVTKPAEEKAEKPAPPKSEPRELRAGTKTVLNHLFRKKRPVFIGLAFGILTGAAAFLFFAGVTAAVLWTLATVSLALNALSIHRQDQAEFGLRSALADVAQLKDKVSDLRTRAKSLENRNASLERKASDLEMRARKLETLTASTKRNVDILDDRVDVGVKDLDERASSLLLQSEIDRKSIENLSKYQNVLRTLSGAAPNFSQPRSRVLSELSFRSLDIWARRLNLEVTRRSLSYLAHRVTDLESRSIGRLDLDLETAVLQILILKSMAGRSVRSLEIGGLFGIGLAMQFECCIGDFPSMYANSADPLYERELPDGRDPYTLQPVNSRVIERNLRWAGARSEEVSVSEALMLDSSSQYDFVAVYGTPLPMIADSVRAGGYILIVKDDFLSLREYPQLELIGCDLGLAVFRRRGEPI